MMPCGCMSGASLEFSVLGSSMTRRVQLRHHEKRNVFRALVGMCCLTLWNSLQVKLWTRHYENLSQTTEGTQWWKQSLVETPVFLSEDELSATPAITLTNCHVSRVFSWHTFPVGTDGTDVRAGPCNCCAAGSRGILQR